jgi:hypothetical protein
MIEMASIDIDASTPVDPLAQYLAAGSQRGSSHADAT